MFVYPCPIRWSDMDANGHVNSSRYGTLLEETRMRMFESLVPADPAERLRRNFLVREQTIKYLRPLATWETPVTVEAWVTALKRVSFEVHYEIKDAEQTYVTASTVMAGVDSTTGRIRRFEAEEMAAMESFLLAPVEAPAGA
ncbi:acyl-CoA thioesterase [Streptomyces sp. BI20]|uniref:acyl-CoA thioesterase n=1 Tax=Streptomyces sp. BI20 TaxID=3403460 RepID=UPI003C7831A3